MFAIRLLIVGVATELVLLLSPAAQAAQRCAPRGLDVSAVQAGSVTVSPLAGSRDASPWTQISFLGVRARDLRRVAVSGSRTGAHRGRLVAYSQGDGASFLPRRAFAPGELVTARAVVRAGRRARALVDRFVISEPDRISETPQPSRAGNRHEIQVFHSRPDLRPPSVAVTAVAQGAAAGDIFAAPYQGPGQSGPMIIGEDGSLVWFKRLAARRSATNLQVQTLAGRPLLTWWQGVVSVHGFGLGEDIIADSTYTPVAHVRAGNGYRADLHDFRLTPRGTALITAYAPMHCNLAAVGGSSDGAVVDGVMQEIDIRTGLVMFEWTSLDHVGLDESYEHADRSSVAKPFDYFHINSIDVDPDGTLLVSARNTWTAYELDASTGQIAWRLGGKRSSFRMGRGTATAWQHDPREIASDEISIFDNGASPAVRGQSRGIVVRIDPAHLTATLVSQLTHSPDLLASSQGNMQLLANGDWFLGWGEKPYFSEVSPTGAVTFAAHFPVGDESYRDFRFPWTGTPAHRPAFALSRPSAGSRTLYASWNGSTLAAAWKVLAGPSPTALTAIGEARRSGFETAISVPAPSAGAYITVQALDASGNVLATGPVERVPAGG
jgi:Arylsulfotransferase (ASST)